MTHTPLCFQVKNWNVIVNVNWFHSIYLMNYEYSWNFFGFRLFEEGFRCFESKIQRDYGDRCTAHDLYDTASWFKREVFTDFGVDLRSCQYPGIQRKLRLLKLDIYLLIKSLLLLGDNTSFNDINILHFFFFKFLQESSK